MGDEGQAMEEAVSEQEVGEIDITVKTITKALKKRTGPDGICKYWLKKFTTLHKPMADASQEVLISQEQLQNWLSAGQQH